MNHNIKPELLVLQWEWAPSPKGAVDFFLPRRLLFSSPSTDGKEVERYGTHVDIIAISVPHVTVLYK